MGANTNCINGKPHMGLGNIQNFRNELAQIFQKKACSDILEKEIGPRQDLFRIQSGTVFRMGHLSSIPIHALTYLYIVACRCRSIQVETSVFCDRTSIRPIFTIFTLFRRIFGRSFPRLFIGIIIFNTYLTGPDFMTSISQLKCRKTALINCPNFYQAILS